jgi:hypothetical protein
LLAPPAAAPPRPPVGPRGAHINHPAPA